MQTAVELKQTVSHGEIAMVARDLWQKEGCQNGRDLEYWLRAEQQLLAVNQPGNPRCEDNAPVKRNVLSVSGKPSASRPAPLAESSASNSRKGKSVRS